MNNLFTIATRFSGLNCPKCGSTSFHKHGKHLDIQRYKCKSCGRTFKETINTPLHWIHNKSKMHSYLSTMRDQQSIRSAAHLLGISKDTSFCWRHKILSSLCDLPATPTHAPAGIIEIRMPHSFKGKTNAPEHSLPDTRTILIADARGIPCLQILPSKNIVRETSRLIADYLITETELARKPNRLISNAIVHTNCSEVKHKAIKENLLNHSASIVSKIST